MQTTILLSKNIARRVLLLFLSLTSVQGYSQEEADQVSEFDRFQIVGLPAFSYNSDEGFGYGVIGTGYWYSPDVSPYRTAITAMLATTTQRVDSTWIEIDTLEPRNLPIRLRAEIGYFVTRTGTFCGTGGQVTCDENVAETNALNAGFSPNTNDYNDFIEHYYLRRYRRPYGFAEARWNILPSHPEFSLFSNSRISWILPGDHGNHEPYSGSLYEQIAPEGNGGRWSILQSGLMWDSRNDESAPSEGIWIEASARYAGAVFGSEWDFVGINSVTRGYQRILPNLVLADRAIMDLIFGEAPLDALGTIGGSSDGRQAFGGLHTGRGLRLQRNPGGLKLINQIELRWQFLRLKNNEKSGLTLVGFSDSAWIASTPSSNDGGFLISYGAGLRASLNDFVVRADIGISSEENYTPSTYILLRHTF